ncbi:hypothetical protein ElyMa_003894600 [Elysia marginata]|uniref:Uncharacterized protein n=1 Tax=Elysia marginata TaxID=1093978 RepID=A0AAV4FN16_9GAST|nr:hypothetical protein ElyMa_003894600 [Elysia marginata]
MMIMMMMANDDDDVDDDDDDDGDDNDDDNDGDDDDVIMANDDDDDGYEDKLAPSSLLVAGSIGPPLLFEMQCLLGKLYPSGQRAQDRAVLGRQLGV